LGKRVIFKRDTSDFGARFSLSREEIWGFWEISRFVLQQSPRLLFTL